MRLSVALAALVLAVLLASGCGSGAATTVTAAAPPAAQSATPASSSAPVSSTATSATGQPAAHPVVRFTLTIHNPRAVWPFTAQLARITKDPNGFPGSGGEPPQDTYLMVQVNITSQITGRLVPPPNLQGIIACHGRGARSWSSWAEGYDAGGSAPEVTGAEVALGDGQPHAWDIEWVVPEATDISRVKCVFGPDPNDPAIEPERVQAIGSGLLN
jgi:hypothetical protein